MQLKAKDEEKTPRVHLQAPQLQLGQAHHLLLSLWWSTIFSSFYLLSLSPVSFPTFFTHLLMIFSSSSLCKRDCNISRSQPLPKCVELLSTHSQNVSGNVSNLQLLFRVATLFTVLTQIFKQQWKLFKQLMKTFKNNAVWDGCRSVSYKWIGLDGMGWMMVSGWGEV